MAKYIRIAQWNANGLLKHKEEIKIFLETNFIDVLLISETHFTNRSYFNIPKYKLYFTNHPDGTAHGGTAILIKNQIKHYELLKYEEVHIQATSIRVETLPYNLTITAVYCPPRHNIKREQYEEFLQTLGPKFIAGGDYNSKHTMWGSRIITTKGRELAQVLHNNNYSFLSTGTPTYWPTDPNKLPDLLDFLITNGISTTYTDIIPSYDLTSDHSPIIATISTTVITKDPKPKLHNLKTNWDTYRQIIQDTVNLSTRLKEPTEIEEDCEKFIKILQHAARTATPINILKKQQNNIPLEIKKLVAEKRKARSLWQRTHTPANRTKYNQISNKLKLKLLETKNESFNSYISNLQRQDNSIWKPIKGKRKPVPTAPPIRKYSTPPGPWARSDKEKAILFAEHLSEVFTPQNNVPVQEVDQILGEPLQTHQTIIITPKEIKEVIGTLNPKKAPGIDLITAKMLKELPKKGLVKLLHIFNAILRLNYWPKPLKIGQIIMILKPGKNQTDVSSYRPISLISTIAKLLERLILNKINTELNPQNWLPSHQFGFRQNHSTIQQCHRIVNTINESLENRQYCTATFLDISQAFDKVWHPGLLCKIKTILPGPYYKAIEAYLHQREFTVKINEENSDNMIIHSGVPQGSILGPFLYLIYTHDLPTTDNTTIGTFADDTAIFATHSDPVIASNNLQDHLNMMEVWLKKWKIKVNESKSNHITFTLRKGNCPPVNINQVRIPQSNQVKYLGLHFDRKLTWKHHIVKKRKQLDLKIKEIQWLIGRNSILSIDNKLLIYKTVLKPIWTYGAELWGCASNSNISIIQRAQSKIIRSMANAPWYVSNRTLHNDLKIPYVKNVIQENIIKHHNRLEDHPNPMLQPLLQPTLNRRLRRIWPLDLRVN